MTTLGFIKRAKGFGLSLGEIADLVTLLHKDRCAPVQDRLQDLLDAKIAETQDRIGELIAFTAELQQVRATLGDHTPEGPCDDRCGCVTDHAPGGGGPVGVTLVARRSGRSQPAVVCTLAPEHVGQRLDDWRALLAQAEGREPIGEGVRVRFPAGVDVGELASLAAAEQACCGFFAFNVAISAEGVALDVTGPVETRPLIDSLVGAAA